MRHTLSPDAGDRELVAQMRSFASALASESPVLMRTRDSAFSAAGAGSRAGTPSPTRRKSGAPYKALPPLSGKLLDETVAAAPAGVVVVVCCYASWIRECRQEEHSMSLLNGAYVKQLCHRTRVRVCASISEGNGVT